MYTMQKMHCFPIKMNNQPQQTVREQLACWCGPSHKQGEFLTYHVLLNDTQQLVTCSNVCHEKDALFPNQCE